MARGVEGKLALWEALQRAHGEDPRLGEIRLDELTARVRSQRERLERERLDTARRAFTTGSS
jgi:hypothetical protein